MQSEEMLEQSFKYLTVVRASPIVGVQNKWQF